MRAALVAALAQVLPVIGFQWREAVELHRAVAGGVGTGRQPVQAVTDRGRRYLQCSYMLSAICSRQAGKVCKLIASERLT
ncbi:hypothetical protein PspR32_04595 [Pseudomonas sp. R32]|nr:hypothetical protein PspR32_04595 [Pseudomonas sp. R32]